MRKTTTTRLMNATAKGGFGNTEKSTSSMRKSQTVQRLQSGNTKIQNSQQIDLATTIIESEGEKLVKALDPILDICVVDTNVLYGCGEFGLKEYELDDKGEVKSQYSLIGTKSQISLTNFPLTIFPLQIPNPLDNQIILDVHQDHAGRLIYTNPEEGAIYLVDGDDIVFVSEFIVRTITVNPKSWPASTSASARTEPNFSSKTNKSSSATSNSTNKISKSTESTTSKKSRPMASSNSKPT